MIYLHRITFWLSHYINVIDYSFLYRYFSLTQPERRRLEEEEDYVLTVMLYNMVAFMIALSINKQSIKSKIRRLLGKSHVGITHSQYVNDLLDVLDKLVRTNHLQSLNLVYLLANNSIHFLSTSVVTTIMIP